MVFSQAVILSRSYIGQQNPIKRNKALKAFDQSVSTALSRQHFTSSCP